MSLASTSGWRHILLLPTLIMAGRPRNSSAHAKDLCEHGWMCNDPTVLLRKGSVR
jgi:hypothetical protein